MADIPAEEMVIEDNSSSDELMLLSDSDDEGIMADAARRVKRVSINMTPKEQKAFVVQLKTDQKAHVKEKKIVSERKRRGSVQYYKDIQSQLQSGVRSLSSERRESLVHLKLLPEKLEQRKAASASASASASAPTTESTSITASSSSAVNKLTLEPMRFGTKPLSTLLPKPTVSAPTPTPKHLVAIKKMSAIASSTAAADAATLVAIQKARRRPQSARVPRQRRPHKDTLAPVVPARLRPYLTAQLTKESASSRGGGGGGDKRRSRKRKRKRKRRELRERNQWSSSSAKKSVRSYLSLSQSHWNSIVASGLGPATTASQELYGRTYLSDAEQLQLKLAESLTALSDQNENSSSRERERERKEAAVPKRERVADEAAEDAWKELRARIQTHCYEQNEKKDRKKTTAIAAAVTTTITTTTTTADQYETFICTRKRDQLIEIFGMFHERTPSTEIIFEAHSAARRAVHSSAFQIQRWWKDHWSATASQSPPRKTSRRGEMSPPWTWHDEGRLARRRQRLKRRSRKEDERLANTKEREMTWKERYATRDDRTKPTGKYLKMGGGRFSTAYPKSDVDWKILRSQKIPGPGAYNPVPLPHILGAAKISTANPKSYLDWAVYYTRDQPGPAAYDISLSG